MLTYSNGLLPGAFLSLGKVCSIWRHVWLSWLQAGVWRGMFQVAVGWSQRCCCMSCSMQGRPSPWRITWSRVNHTEVEKLTLETAWLWVLSMLLTHWVTYSEGSPAFWFCGLLGARLHSREWAAGDWVYSQPLYLQPLSVANIAAWAPPRISSVAALDCQRSSNPAVSCVCMRDLGCTLLMRVISKPPLHPPSEENLSSMKPVPGAKKAANSLSAVRVCKTGVIALIT